MDDRIGIYSAIRTECVASETLVAAVPELHCLRGLCNKSRCRSKTLKEPHYGYV